MITQALLKEYFSFDPNKGRFFWKIRKRGIRLGDEVGSYDAHGYGQIRINGKTYKEHRLVWLYIHGEMPTSQIDHINHNRRDNRPENLRLADNVENHKNRPMQKNNTSGFVGVYLDKLGGYVAYITVDGKRISLGRFKSIDDAISCRKKANIKYGFHDNHGHGYGVSKRKEQAEKQAIKRKLDRENMRRKQSGEAKSDEKVAIHS